MTIDEAIAHAKKRAKQQRILSSANHEGIESCIKCAEEHEQLAGWLEQLKRLIKLKEAMDNFVESVEVWCYLHEGEYDQKDLDELLRMVEEIKKTIK